MMQTQHVPTPHHNMEKQMQQEGSENNSMDEKKESSTADTVGSMGSHTYHHNAAMPHQNMYNPYAAAAAAQYHNMMVVQQHHHHHQVPSTAAAAAATMLHHPHAHHAASNGVHPPQQVYINNVMQQQQVTGATLGHLETHFQSLGLNHDNGDGNDSNNEQGNHGGNRNNDSDNGGSGEEGGMEGGDEEHGDEDEQPVKLFVGQVPKTMNEEDIFPTFDSFGPLKDVSIIRDKHTQLHRGCAFVTYWSSEDAEKAQEALHGKHTFPGARRPAQVKPAEPSVPENKLFIGMLSRKAGEDEVRQLFEPFGEIREIYMIRNADGSSKCAAFLRYVERDAAVHAIESLHSNLVMDGAARPLIVKFADNKHQRQQRHIRNVRRHEMMAAMGPGGFPGYPPHMMGPHSGGPPHYAPMGPPQYAPPYGGPAGGQHPAHPHAYMYPPQFGGHPHYGYRQESSNPNRNPNNPRPREGPAGANLFVYHLPHDLTDADLATAFNPFGNVISAKVYMDRYTGESKGFGFVSYDSVISAESAIEQMNGFQIGNKRLKVQHKRVHGNSSGGEQDQDASEDYDQEDPNEALNGAQPAESEGNGTVQAASDA